MMRLLIAVKSCEADLRRGYHQVIRDTWGKDVAPLGIDLVFFLGNFNPIGIGLKRDEVSLDCEDGYGHLPFKSREICRHSVARGYEHVFLCDTDSFLVPRLLQKVGYEAYDYYGLIQKPIGQKFAYDAIDREGKHHPGEYYPWASGGFGYFVSRKAAALIAQFKPNVWAEDVWTAQIMNIQYNLGQMTIGDAKNLAYQCSWHFPAHEYNSGYDLRFNWMPEMYEKHGASQ